MTRMRNSTDGQGAILSQPLSPNKTGEGGTRMTALLEAGSKRQKSTTRIRNLTDGHNDVILSQPLSPNKTAEGEASMTTSLEAGSKRLKSTTRMRNSTDGQDGALLSRRLSPNKTVEGEASMTPLLEAGSKKPKCTARMRKSTDGQDGAILFPPLPPNKIVEGEASMTASLEAGNKKWKSSIRMRSSTDGQDGAILSQPLSPIKTFDGEVSMTALLEAGSKRLKSTTRMRNSTDGQDGAILSQPLSPNKTAEGEVRKTASVLEGIINRRAEKRQGVNEMSHAKEAALKKTIPKTKSGCLVKLQHTLRLARVYNDPAQMESHDPVVSMIATQKEETKSNISLEVGIRNWKSRKADFDIHLDTSKRRKAKQLKEIDTGDSTRASGKETSEDHHNKLAHTECDSGLSSITSARKRLKQILPPPLPLPLVSVSKQLVSKAFGLKTSRSGRLLVPALAHWRGQSLVRDMDGGIIAIEGGSQDAPKEDTGCFTFKAPTEARAQKLQKWLCDTATECWTRKLKARKKASNHKQ